MKDMIERYIYAVVRRLPETTREEVKEELRGNIYDMLPEKPTEAEIEKVLLNLGNPRDMAVKYQAKERYLISPRYFDDYIYVLKIVVAILVIVSAVVGLIEALTGRGNLGVWEFMGSVFSKTFGNAIEGAFNGFIFTTIVFVIIEQVQLNSKKPWEIKDLPELPKENKVNISRAGTIVSLIFSMTFSIIFIMILAEYHEVIGIYTDGNLLAEFFNPDYVKIFLPIFIGLLVFSLIVHALKLMDGRWTWRVTITYTIYQIAEMIVVIIFLMSPDLMNNLFSIELANVLEISLSEVTNGFKIGFRALSIMIGVITAIDLASTWYKVIRFEKKQTKKVN